MDKVAVVYWSGTGNTEKMARAVLEGARATGTEAELYSAREFKAAKMKEFDAFAFGCPAMGAEVLEEFVFEPMFEECEEKLSGKKTAIFGSYGWGSGEWMEDWERRVKADGARLVSAPVICNEAPDADGLEACKKLGAALVS